MTVADFIARWKRAAGTELANAQIFVYELCGLLGLPCPNPAQADDAANSYVFERPVTFVKGDGSQSPGRIDCYRRDAFVLEAKKIREGRKSGSSAYDEAMFKARDQAERYARAIPAAEGRPPFLIVVDVGFRFELYADFTRSGATYTPFPSPGRHRFEIADLEKEDFRELLKKIWLDPLSLVRQGKARRFGFITTNSIKQTFNRRILESHMRPVLKPGSPGVSPGEFSGDNSEANPAGRRGSQGNKPALHLAFAIPDHPWVDAADAAAVRIAMTVGSLDPQPGTLSTVIQEADHGDADGYRIESRSTQAQIHPDLSTGADVTEAQALKANADITSMGVMLAGDGFIVTPDEAEQLGLGSVPGMNERIRDYRNGKDLTQRPRGVFVIDTFGLSEAELRHDFPSLYQHLLHRVKPERDQNNRESRRHNWWLFGEPNPKLRKMLAGLPRYIATVETTKHRLFQFLDQDILPDNKLVNIALADAAKLAILSSQVHVTWAAAIGSRLGRGFVYRQSTPNTKSRAIKP